MTDQPTAAMSASGPERMIADRYRLEGLLGRGGSAEVWRCRDEALDRLVALKLVTASGGEDAGRVGDEARLLARLSHPGLVPVYDAGTDDAGRPWVVMELVEGETLAEAIRRGAMPPERVADVGARLADALAYVHDQGLVHRDVKPANVLLGGDGRVRLTDFGIARLVDAAKVTATGLTVGTASYLSPEQVTGSPVGPATDVYALGLVLLECLTGEREYPGSAVEVALARLSRAPRVPSTLPYGWPGLLAAMTGRNPSGRPVAAVVARELRVMAAGGEATTVLPGVPARPSTAARTQLLRSLPVTTGPAPTPAPRLAQRTAAPRRRRSPWVGPFVLLLLVAALAGAALLYSRQHAGPAAVPAQVPVGTRVPGPLRQDLVRLQQQVGR